jgi:hypothetical protein
MNEPSKESTASPAGRGWRPRDSSPPAENTAPPKYDLRPEGVPVDPRASDVFVGVARAVHERAEGASDPPRIVWTFRLERYDEAGDRLQPVPVEMRGRSFEGAISEGDTVEVYGRWRDGTTLRADRARNRTTGAVVTAKGYGKLWLLLIPLVIGLAIIAVLILIGIHETNMPHRFSYQKTPSISSQ